MQKGLFSLSGVPISGPLGYILEKRLHAFAVKRRRLKVSEKMNISIIEKTRAEPDTMSIAGL